MIFNQITFLDWKSYLSTFLGATQRFSARYDGFGYFVAFFYVARHTWPIKISHFSP